MNRNTNLDIIRFFAAFMVLSVHIGQSAGIDMSVGAKGVQTFFVLSGFCIFRSLDNETSLKTYYAKRAIRILPTYWICLLILYFEAIITGAKELCSIRFFRYIFMVQCFTPTSDFGLWNNYSALWTMSSFAFFYIVAPFLHRVMKNFYLSLVGVLAVALITPYIITVLSEKMTGYPPEAGIEYFLRMNPLAEVYCFLMGGLLWIAIKNSKQALYIIILLAMVFVRSLSWCTYETLSVVMILVAVSFEPIINNPKLKQILVITSSISFTLYLIHPILIRHAGVFWKYIGERNKYLYAICLYLVSIGIAWMLYYGIISHIEHRIREKIR